MTYQGTTAKRSSTRFKFISETIAELKKVVWLSRREVAYLTVLVIIVCVIVGLILGIVDYGFTQLVNNVFLSG
ncbi:MAG: preprotein translocase subunit SecE [Chloroflexota bacterium]